MHIVQIAPPWFPIPPRGYGGIERVIYDLTEGLVAAGQTVTLVAPAGSRTSAHLVAAVPGGVGLNLSEDAKQDHFLAYGRRAYDLATTLGADIVHDHTDFSPDPSFPLPIVRTIHGPAVEHHVAMYRAMSQRGDHFLAISKRQQELFEAAAHELFGPGDHLTFLGVIHNPIDVAAMPFYPAAAKEEYVAFLGRCHWEKDPAGAIQVAMAADVPLKMALRVTTQERPYFEAVVQPALRRAGSLVEYVGEVDGVEKRELIGRSRAVIFSSPWEEPFGLVQTEAGAHGTPVVALRLGAAPEIITDGVNGYLSHDLGAMARQLPAAMALDPVACRAHVAAHFDRPVIVRRLAALLDAVRITSDVEKRPIAARPFADARAASIHRER